jgi:hypothetical protein
MSLQRSWMNHKLRSRERELMNEFRQATTEESQDEWWEHNKWELFSISDHIKENYSLDLLERAEKLGLSPPKSSDKDKWDVRFDTHGAGQYLRVLTPEATTELRDAIGREKRERREVVESWSKIAGTFIAILTGLVGTIIGLAAIWKR